MEQLQLKLQAATEEVHSCEVIVGELQSENEGLQMEREELKAELAYVQTRVKRLERLESRTSEVASGTRLPTTIPVRGLTEKEVDAGRVRELDARAPAFHLSSRKEDILIPCFPSRCFLRHTCDLCGISLSSHVCSTQSHFGNVNTYTR